MEEQNELKILKRNQYIIMFLILVILITLIIIGSGSNKTRNYNNSSNGGNQNPSEEQTPPSENTEYDVSSFKEVSATELESQSKSSTKVVYIGRSTCGYCTAFIPTLKKAQEEYNYTTLYIDIAKIIDFTLPEFKILDQKGFDSIINLDTTDDYKGYLDQNFGATPMVLILKNSKVIAIQTGYNEYDEFKSFLNTNGIK